MAAWLTAWRWEGMEYISGEKKEFWHGTVRNKSECQISEGSASEPKELMRPALQARNS